MVPLSTPDTELIEVLKQPVEICDPYDQNNDNQAVQDRFDLPLHGDESVHKPQQDACCNNRDDDGGKWHIVFSNHFPDSIRSGVEFEFPRAVALDPHCSGKGRFAGMPTAALCGDA
jgi:hypothetical protein